MDTYTSDVIATSGTLSDATSGLERLLCRFICSPEAGKIVLASRGLSNTPKYDIKQMSFMKISMLD